MIGHPARWAALGAWVLLGAALGCYKPEIKDGGFICGPGGSCPDGYSCRDNHCFKGGASTTTDGGGDDGGGCVMPQMCSAIATPPPVCDPVCQKGCGCNEKCTNPGDGNVCQPAGPSPAMLYDSCDPLADTCRPGAVCLPEFQDRCGAHCYRFCRDNSDCPPMSRCHGEAHDPGGKLLYKICSPRLENCNPTGANPRCGPLGNQGRNWPAFACYMLSTDNPDDSVCECAGVIPVGSACSQGYSCVPGSECVAVGSDAKCRRLCTPQGSTVLPPVVCLGQTCQAFPNSNNLGFCL